MVVFKIQDDENESQQMECFINQKQRIAIYCGCLDNSNEIEYTGFCTLNKEDAVALISALNEMLKDIE